MLSPATFRQIVSGERGGIAGPLARGLLRLAETPYAAAVRWRNRRYDLGRTEICRVGVPVVSVGNLTLGGTGKTPMVEWLVRWFLARGKRVAIVSRGYGNREGQPNDEALELAARLPGVPHVQHRDRVAAAERAMREHRAEVIVADDGFQHRRLARDLDIVLLDAAEPFGFGHVFPRGMLREPIAGLSRAAVVVLTRCDMVDAARRAEIQRRVRSLAPQATWTETSHAPVGLINAAGERALLEWLANRRVAAFCGIGNPAAFRHTLAECRAEVVAFREFADHFDYGLSTFRQSPDAGLATSPVLDSLGRWAAGEDVEAVVTTHKDLVKVRRRELGGKPLWAVMVGLRMLAGEEELVRRLDGLVSG